MRIGGRRLSAALGKIAQRCALIFIKQVSELNFAVARLEGGLCLYNEFVVLCPDAQTVNEKLNKEGIIGGYELAMDYPELESALVFCVTEMISKADMDHIVRILK